MISLKDIGGLRSRLQEYRSESKTVGLVPTMGFFHKGHLSLMDIAKKNSDVVVVSLFVNPTQFAPTEDLDRYPRDYERDEKLAAARGVDLLFYPDVREMYPDHFYTYVITEKLAAVLCGVSRQTHFRGVTTIVAKLFNIIQPDVAVFGQKDAQQAIIIQQMVRDLNFPIRILLGPIVREPDGLAMSSRNVYLNPEERRQAVVLNQALRAARQAVDQGERDSVRIRTLIQETISRAPLAKIDYIEIISNPELDKVKIIQPGTFAALAVLFGKTRLIDNIILMD